MNSLTRKMLWPFFSLIPLLTLANQLSWCKVPPEPIAHFTISVHNDAGVPAGTLQRAEQEAARVFRQAGMDVTWLNCGVRAPAEEAGMCREVLFPAHLQLRIVRKSRGLNDDTLGVSFLAADGSGCQADLFYEPMEQLRDSNNANLASLLGHVAAHEVGHLLLGINSHSPAGIMRAHWSADEISAAGMGALFFSPSESEKMRQTLSIRAETAKLAPQLHDPH